MLGPDDVDAIASELRVVLARLIRRLRAEHHFSPMHGAVLGRLDRQGPQTTADLAAAERVRPQSMGQTLAELEAQRLIARRPDQRDRRCVLLDLTDQGRRVLAENRQRRDGWLAQAIEQNFSPDEQRLLARAVSLIARLVEQRELSRDEAAASSVEPLGIRT